MKWSKEITLSKQSKKLLLLFIKAVAVTLMLAILIVIGIVAAYNKFIYDEGVEVVAQAEEVVLDKETVEVIEKSKKDEEVINKNLAVFGVDRGGSLTDVIFVIHFNSETNKAKVISVPRDTRVEWTEAQQQVVIDQGKGRWQVSKLNEMTGIGGIKNIRALTVNQLENILGVPIDNYVVVTLDAFAQIVDAVGGVEVDVPHRMQYTDYSGGLFIDLQPGLQVLDGDKAEQFVRYRQYVQGDVARISNQQLFLEAFARQVLRPQTITKLPQIVTVIFSSLQTDIKLTEIPQYYTYIENFDIENLSFHIVPGVGATGSNGISYYFLDMDEMEQFLEEVFE